MAVPTILVNSATGSDTTSSGAGPATALSGTTNASTDAAGTTVTLPAGTDLSGVAVDGSHVIYLVDATAGARNFGKITGSAGSGGATPTVTVANAFGINLTTKSWAIGGKRASIGSTSSGKLFDNNGAAGDALPGWAVEMESGHTETLAATFNLRRAGDTTTGAIFLRGTSGAATPPVVTFSNNGAAFFLRAGLITIRDFDIRNTNATKTASIAITQTNGGLFDLINILGMKIAHSTNKFWKGIVNDCGGSMLVKDCEVGFTANVGIAVTSFGSSIGTQRFIANFVHDCGAGGFFLGNNNYPGLLLLDNIVYNITGIGISLDDAATSADTTHNMDVIGNTVDTCTSDGFKWVSANTNILGGVPYTILNNISSNNGGYGFNFSAVGFTTILRDVNGLIISNNDTFNNTSAAYNPASYGVNDPGLNPTYTAAASGDFSIGSNLKAQGYPSVIGKSGTTSYMDIGAAQRPEGVGYLLVAN